MLRLLLHPLQREALEGGRDYNEKGNGFEVVGEIEVKLDGKDNLH